ncbi:MAG: response regulator [Deltaproteobacteria bacterium]|nr:response regulator [Deltaproteobacteria bacterium]
MARRLARLKSFGPVGPLLPMREKPWLLVVDDAPTILKLVKDLLTPDYLVETAGSVLEAQVRLETRAFDLVLTDMVMPGLGGMDLVQHVRLHHPHIPVIVLTGYGNFQDAVQAVKLGAFDYLTKPIQGDILRHAICRALEFRRLTQVERDLEVIFQGAEALGWQALDLLTETAEAEVLASLRQESSEAGDLSQVARRFLQGAKRLVGATRSSIFLYHPGRHRFQGLAALGPAATVRANAAVELNAGVMGRVIQHRRPLLVTDVHLDQRLALLPQRYRYQSNSFMIIPLLGSRFWGVINLTDREDGASFGSRDLFLGWLLGRLFVEVLEAREPQADLDLLPVLGSLLDQHLPLGLALVDANLRVVHANPALLALVGWPGDTLTGQELLPLLKLSPAEGEMLAQALHRHLADQECREFSALSSSLQSPRPLFLSLKLAPFPSRSEAPQSLVLVEDVSEREHLRQRLLLYEHLAIMGKLSLCVAHELNNPLDGIRRYLSLALRRKEEPGEVERYLTEAQKGLHKMSLTIRSLMSSANPLKAPRATDNLWSLLQDAVKIMMFQASDQRVEVILHLPPEFRQVKVNGDLYHVFVNLIKNALQSMPEGGELRIEGGLPGEQVELTFQDTGPGLSPEELSKIFLPFYSTKEGAMGLGLGLPICRKILERYRGGLQVESAPGQGTRVRLSFSRQAAGGHRAA